MKNQYFTLLLIGLLTGFNLYSQQIIDDPDAIPSQKGDYIKDNRINEYIGTWEWKNENETLTIVIEKRKLKANLGTDFYVYKDMALGWYKYVKNGVIIDNNLEQQNIKLNTFNDAHEHASLFGGSNKNDISFTFQDFKSNKKYRVIMKLSPNKQEVSWIVYSYNSTVALKDKIKQKKKSGNIKLELVGVAENVSVTQNKSQLDEDTFYLPVDVTLKKVK